MVVFGSQSRLNPWNLRTMDSNNYFPQIFIPKNLEHAKEIILSTDPTGEKWIRETEVTANFVVRACVEARLPLGRNNILLDYGCGIGRIAKKIIELTDCTVLGSDISPGMLHHSIPYVNSERFIPCPQPGIDLLSQAGLKVDGATAIWTLQHCLNPAEDINRIYEILKPNGLFFVLNKYARYVPVTPVNNYVRWHDDKIDILKCIEGKFQSVDSLVPFDCGPEEYFRVFQKKVI